MPTRSHTAEIVLPVSVEAAFRLLITPSAIREWWQASRAIVLPEAGGVWAATWGEQEDDPDYITVAKISVYDPPRRLTLTDYSYRSKTGPLPFQADFVTTFEVEQRPEGSRLRVTQAGFPADARADEFYASCERGWQQTLRNICNYCDKQLH